MNAVKVLESYDVKEIYAACSHGVLSGPAVERIKNSSINSNKYIPSPYIYYITFLNYVVK